MLQKLHGQGESEELSPSIGRGNNWARRTLQSKRKKDHSNEMRVLRQEVKGWS
jgi:hypothetical protein